jgi:hypothetical protein
VPTSPLYQPLSRPSIAAERAPRVASGERAALRGRLRSPKRAHGTARAGLSREIPFCGVVPMHPRARRCAGWPLPRDAQRNSFSSEPDISANVRYVTYMSAASNLVPDDSNGCEDVFVFDRKTGATERISVASDGTEANSFSFGGLDISANGRYVTYTSFASNLVPGDTNDTDDIFLYDRKTETTERISVAGDGTEGKFFASEKYPATRDTSFRSGCLRSGLRLAGPTSWRSIDGASDSPSRSLIDHLVGARQERGRGSDAECFGGSQARCMEAIGIVGFPYCWFGTRNGNDCERL